jgi:hypothetical protein
LRFYSYAQIRDHDGKLTAGDQGVSPRQAVESWYILAAMLRHVLSVLLLLQLPSKASAQIQSSLSGEWATPLGAVFTLSETDSTGNVTVIPGTWKRPEGFGTLRRNATGVLEGEVVMGRGCIVQLSLSESEDGMKLSGTGRMSRKSTRSCLSSLTKEAKKGAPFPYYLLRR